MSTEERDDLKEYFDGHFNRLMDKVETIERGVYGDEKNKVPGLTARLIMVEQKVKKLFQDRARVIWVGSAFVTGVSVIWEAAKWYFK